MNDRYESFAVRLWVTRRGIAHGVVTRAADGTRSRFRDPKEIVDFIERSLAADWLDPHVAISTGTAAGPAANGERTDEDMRGTPAHLNQLEAESDAAPAETNEGGTPEQS